LQRDLVLARIFKNGQRWLLRKKDRSKKKKKKERDLVEAAGVEPASESFPHQHLHTYPVYQVLLPV
jgi:hypothetical protein